MTDRVAPEELVELATEFHVDASYDEAAEAGATSGLLREAALLNRAAQYIERLEGENERLRTEFAQVLDDHIDYPQAVSHAEMRDTAKACREGTWPHALSNSTKEGTDG